MPLINDPSRLNHTIQFGTVISIDNDNHVPISTFSPQFSCYCAIFKRTIDQTFSTLQTEQQDNVTVIIYHNEKVNTSLSAILNKIKYRVIDVEPDETSAIIRYDTVILRKVSK
ncbi:phage head closure protein [Sporolactobacillus shoreicorticis]|uniref:Phage head closure protein n=1 Tax=Sporolactobacillus shoreicorticis TaxID=1923877 RepID=A0ABW5S699_9BACL|nr:phage head closure protein [Sporolactobacillus shoreicorticis]MCO7126636.1 phage head closure protein [Sporolactobacillus shoreicorticis]